MPEKIVEQQKIVHKNIYEALSAFQGELKTLPKNGHVEYPTAKGIMKYDYTPLGDIMAYIYPLLAKHGLSVRHEISETGVEAILAHGTYKSAQPIFTATDVATGNMAEPGSIHMVKDFQKFESLTENEIRSGIVKLKGGAEMKDTGAAITYARRYTLTMLLGLSSEDDKDAELLEGSAKNAIAFAESKAKQGIRDAKTIPDLVKAVNVLKKDKELVKGGKAGALGLTEEKYDELLELAEQRAAEINSETKGE